MGIVGNKVDTGRKVEGLNVAGQRNVITNGVIACDTFVNNGKSASFVLRGVIMCVGRVVVIIDGGKVADEPPESKEVGRSKLGLLEEYHVMLTGSSLQHIVQTLARCIFDFHIVLHEGGNVEGVD